MPDYKKMYFEMVRETEKAINILIAAQKRCEEMYIEDEVADLELSVLENVNPAPETSTVP